MIAKNHACLAVIGGSGLGLALARRYIEAHRGQITFTSVPGQGSDFYFLLPAAIPSAG